MTEKSSRVAFIIPCHKNPEQINLLTKSLSALYDCHIFIHLDQKSSNMGSQIHTDGMTLLPSEKSADVRWGTFSQCKATLALIDAVLNAEDKFDYVWLISGQDLPIVDRERANHLFPDSPVPFMEVMGPDHPAYQQFAKRNDIYYPNCLMQNTVPAGIGRKLLKYATGGTQHTWPIFRRKLDIPCYFGSSWWCLPYDCVQEMMQFLNLHQELLHYFRNAINSDESFFQTLFMQTSYAGRQQKNLTYVDWSEGLASPRTFTGAQWYLLEAAGKHYAFARKFDYESDPAVCQRVLSELCSLSWNQEIPDFPQKGASL